MVTVLRREFTVNVPLHAAWDHLARVEQWPSWAKHIRRIDLNPPNELGPNSIGVIQLKNGFRSTFAMTEFNPYSNWKWSGPFLWLTAHYDHIFEKSPDGKTKITLVIDGEGLGAAVLGRLLAWIYGRSLDVAIPRLVDQMSDEPMAACNTNKGDQIRRTVMLEMSRKVR